MIARTSASLAAMVIFLLVTAVPARAHATLFSSSPMDGAVLTALPPMATLTFDEPVRPVADDITVLDPDGRRVGGRVAADGPRVTVGLPRSSVQGTYTLTWRVISADSHPVGGAITFSLGHPSRTAAAAAAVARTSTVVSAAFTVVRFAGFTGFALLAGGIAFCCYGLPEALDLRGVRALIVTGWAALVAGTFGSLLFEGPYGAGAGLGALVRPELLTQTLSSTYGKALTARALLLALLPSVLAYGLPRLRAGRGRRVFGGIAGVVMALMAATWSVGGHAVTSTQPVGTAVSDVAHLCAMALWLGGLATVTVTLRRVGPAATKGVARFSTVAAAAVAVLVGTGLYQGWVRVQTPQALFTTPYGLTLTVKVALVGLVLCVAFFSRRTLRRRVTGVPARLVAVETGGALCVVAVTALLVALEPAGKALAAEPVTLTGRYDSGGLRGTVSLRLPNRARGLSTGTLTVRDAAGRPREVPELDVAWSLPRRGIGPLAARVTPNGPGRYTAVTAPISVTGTWRIAVTIRTGDIDETTVAFSQTIR